MFCANCGRPIYKNARYCPFCGAENSAALEEAPGQSPLAVTERGRIAVGKGSIKEKIWRIFSLPLAVILILIGSGYLVLPLAGRRVEARVTACEQVLVLQDDPSSWDSRRYRLKYQFFVNGEGYTGSVIRIFKNGSQVRNTLPVRYLSFWPSVNAEEAVQLSVAGPIFLAAGVLLLVISRRKAAVVALLLPVFFISSCATFPPIPSDEQILQAVVASNQAETEPLSLVYEGMEVPHRYRGRAHALLWVPDESIQRNFTVVYDRESKSFQVEGYITLICGEDGVYREEP